MPGLTLPISSTRSPPAKRRGFPKRCMRAISSASSTGNVCARRASSVGVEGASTISASTSARSFALFPTALLDFSFFLGGESSEGLHTQPLERDRTATQLAHPVRSLVHLGERAIDLREQRALLTGHAEQLLLLLGSLGHIGRVPRI